MKYRVAFLSVVPSPYQRDIFAALSRRDDVDLRVHYLEAAAPDSPWPDKPLPPCSQILPGFWFPIGSARCHVNLPLPDFRDRDIVVLNTMMSLTAQWLMRAALRRKPWIFWGERLAGRARGGLHRCLTSPLHRAAAIVGIGSLAERQYAAMFPEPRHYCIPYHCELTSFLTAQRPARDPAETVFLFCGQMIARKGLDHLLQAFTSIAARYPRSRLLLAGREADLPALLATVPEPARSRIEYAGFQPPEDLPQIFARADVFILPSRYDGWGVVVNQAIGAGLPVICSDAVGAAHDLVEPGVNGLRFPPGDVPALTQCMERLAADPVLVKKWGAASRAKAAAWTPDRGAAKWVNVFQEVLGK
ncbi:MAG: glycosyltransferase family 4 protein [Chthoniobacteraceae bacterium]|jgi:glycosyltransferase involved in cell wall biosynthesis